MKRKFLIFALLYCIFLFSAFKQLNLENEMFFIEKKAHLIIGTLNTDDSVLREETLISETKEIDREFENLTKLLKCKNKAEIVYKWSKHFNVSYKIIVAIIYTESENKSYAISKVGARGLMQIMPLTANYILRAKNQLKLAKIVLIKPEILNKDINLNIMCGIQHFKDLVSMTGNWENALHSYNMGYVNFKKGRRNYLYVKKVLNNYDKIK